MTPVKRTDSEKLDALATALMVKCDGYGRITAGRMQHEARVGARDFDRLIADVPFVVNQRAPGWTAVIESPSRVTATGKRLDTVWAFTAERKPNTTRRALGRLRAAITKNRRALAELDVSEPAGPALRAVIDKLIAQRQRDIKMSKLIDVAADAQ